MIRVEAGMSTARFCRLLDMPERTWRRWQARTRAGQPARGPWPAPVTERVEPYGVKHAEAHPAWGHRKVWAMTRHAGHRISPSTTLRIPRRRGLVQPADYTRERRRLARLTGARSRLVGGCRAGDLSACAGPSAALDDSPSGRLCGCCCAVDSVWRTSRVMRGARGWLVRSAVVAVGQRWRGYAARRYSWIRPPRRSIRSMQPPAGGAGAGDGT